MNNNAFATNFCPVCGHANRKQAQFCGGCGRPLARKRAWWWVAGLIVPAFLLFLLWFQTQSPPDAPPLTPTTAGISAQLPSRTASSTPLSTAVTVTPLVSTTPPVPLIPTATPTPRPTNTPTPSPTATETPDLGPETIVYGQSVNGRALQAVRFGGGGQVIILIGGMHAGFTPGSVAVAQQAVAHFQRNLGELPASITLYIIPIASPDSPSAPGELRGRLNARGVDLNRNWGCRWTANPTWRNQVVAGAGGAAPFSEPETTALRDFILARNPVAVVFWEARASGGLVSAGNCHDRPRVSAAIAGIYGLAAGYAIADFENLTNQELNGDSTNWLDDQGIPAISVLLPGYTDADWNSNLAGIRALLDSFGQ